MTNQLFRDLLDGRIPMAVRDPYPFWRAGMTTWQEEFIKAVMDDASASWITHHIHSAPATGWDEWGKQMPTMTSFHTYYQTSEPVTDEIRALIYGAPRRPRDGYSIGPIIYDETDHRDRALRSKLARGTGPALDTLRTRGRTNRYQTKG